MLKLKFMIMSCNVPAYKQQNQTCKKYRQHTNTENRNDER